MPQTHGSHRITSKCQKHCHDNVTIETVICSIYVKTVALACVYAGSSCSRLGSCSRPGFCSGKGTIHPCRQPEHTCTQKQVHTKSPTNNKTTNNKHTASPLLIKTPHYLATMKTVTRHPTLPSEPLHARAWDACGLLRVHCDSTHGA